MPLQPSRIPTLPPPSTPVNLYIHTSIRSLSSRSFSRAGYHPPPRGRFFNPLFFFPTWFVFFLRRLRSARLRCSDNREPSESLSIFFSHLTRLPCPSPFHLSLHILLLLARSLARPPFPSLSQLLLLYIPRSLPRASTLSLALSRSLQPPRHWPSEWSRER